MLAQKGPNGEALGITVDLARELAKRLGVPVELVIFDAAGKAFEALKARRLDIGFLAIEPVRAAEVDFTAPYVLIEGTYMVPKDSAAARPSRTSTARASASRVDKGSAYDLFLTRTLKNATLVRAPTGRRRWRCSCATSSRPPAASGSRWRRMPRTDPSVRVMDGRFMAIQQAMGMPKGRAARARTICAASSRR